MPFATIHSPFSDSGVQVMHSTLHSNLVGDIALDRVMLGRGVSTMLDSSHLHLNDLHENMMAFLDVSLED